MKKALLGLVGSKKFWTMVGGTILLAVTDHLGVNRDVVLSIAALVGLNLAGIAAADVGKEKTRIKVEAIRGDLAAKVEGKSPAERAAALADAGA